jgi:hypothetical protein
MGLIPARKLKSPTNLTHLTNLVEIHWGYVHGGMDRNNGPIKHISNVLCAKNASYAKKRTFSINRLFNNKNIFVNKYKYYFIENIYVYFYCIYLYGFFHPSPFHEKLVDKYCHLETKFHTFSTELIFQSGQSKIISSRTRNVPIPASHYKGNN